MANFFKDNRDLLYYVDKGIDWDPIVELSERGFMDKDEGGHESTADAVEFYRELMSMVGEFSANEIAPYEAEIDRAGIGFEDGEAVFPDRLNKIFEQINDLELHSLCVPRELGGMNAPLLVYLINSEIMGRADVSTMAHHGFHGGMAMAALVFSIQEGTTKVDENARIVETRFNDVIQEIITGRSWGCMDITEPDAGSDMAALRARGEQDENGDWFVTGEKIFITSGHGKWHFVIARTEETDPADPMAGLGGLSMFLVPTYHEENGERRRVVPLSRVEEKLGHHGSATCGLVFDRAPARLIGKRGEGFRYMLLLMNNARLGVGFECLGLLEATLRRARAYCEERASMGKTIDRHEMIADYLDEMEADIVGVRAMAMKAAWHEELAQKLRLSANHYPGLSDAERQAQLADAKRHTMKARQVTPLLKYYAAEKAVEHARMCIQLHGGNGYTTEYGAEKLLRDAVVMPIYEGTSQIQSLMAMKDTLGGIIKNPQRFVRLAAQARWRALSSRDPLERRLASMQSQSFSVQQHLMMRTAGDKAKSLRDQPITQWVDRFAKNWNPKRDFAYAMLHAERLTKILTDVAIGEALLSQARKHEERRPELERWLERTELRVEYNAKQITEGSDRILRQLSRLDGIDAGAYRSADDSARAAE